MMDKTDTRTGRTCALANRGIVEVGGPDAEKFLGDLLTGDVVGTGEENACYAGLLSPQGKVLFDALVFRRGDRFLLDVPRESTGVLAKRLSIYKLRARVDIGEPGPGLVVHAFWGGDMPEVPDIAAGVVADPRLPSMGYRAVIAAGAPIRTPNHDLTDETAYHRHRLKLGVPEAPGDFIYGEVFPHDIGMDQLGGVDFEKGCYIGQEVVSRMRHRGTARRRIVLVEGEQALPPAGTSLEAEGRALGTLGSSDGAMGLAVVRLDRASEALAGGTTISAGQIGVSLELPSWASYGWPAEPD